MNVFNAFMFGRFGDLYFKDLERAAGIEPAPRAWKARVIPFHHARADLPIIQLAAEGQG